MATHDFDVLRIGMDGIEFPANWLVDTADCAAEGTHKLASFRYDAVIVIPPLEDAAVAELLRQRSAPTVIFDPAATTADVVRYMRLGAFDVVDRKDDAVARIEAAADACRQPARASDLDPDEPWRDLLVGSSPAMRRTAEIIRLVAARRSTVLISGETGTGKEVVARAVHTASPRGHLPMVTVNVAALAENLVEAELFGHVKGAFTGALQQRIGRFEQANRSTLFLDEIGDLPLDSQTKLLRFLQEREVQRVGSSETIRIDARLIAATHVNLMERVRQGKFREDLYYRLNVVPVTTPPLRERLEDVPLLAGHFIRKICGQEQIALRRLAPETLSKLRSCAWPGNVRELENAVERAVALSGDRELLLPSDFALAPETRPAPSGHFDQTVGRMERELLEEALRKTGGNKTAAAGMLGLKRTTLSAKLRSLGAAG
ncbi:MAG TPA: sigma-54 dependent transcriptional regulator [Bryobacteraceae bacterium]